MFAYLKAHNNSEMAFDPFKPDIDMNAFPKEDWSLIMYGHVQEELPLQKPFEESGPADIPEPRGRGFRITKYGDCNLGGDCVTRQSRMGFVVFLNGVPLYPLSKKQASCEISMLGSEFTVMKQALEYVRGLQYKLCMIGLPVYEPAFVFGNNKSVLANTTIPSSAIKKKMNSLSYHFIHVG